MTLRNGKFYNESGEIVPLEHGNKEQIKLLNKVYSAINVGIRTNIIIKQTANILFRCLCGSLNELHSQDIDLDEDITDSIVGQTHSCYKCNQKYTVFKDEFEDIVLKIKIE